MSKAQQDTEITLGIGRMLIIFFAFVLVCAVFFSIGFSLGRKTALAGITSPIDLRSQSPAVIVRPSAAKNEPAEQAPQSGDFSFFKAVGEKNADTALKPQDAKLSSTTATAAASPATPSPDAPKPPSDTPALTPISGGYYVQVAAVSRQEDAEALVEALKKKQYPAFSANNPATDKFFHVQVGPYADIKEAETMRTHLIGDGYNPIVKK